MARFRPEAAIQNRYSLKGVTFRPGHTRLLNSDSQFEALWKIDRNTDHMRVHPPAYSQAPNYQKANPRWGFADNIAVQNR